MRIVSAQEAMNHIPPNSQLFIHGGAATPHLLLSALYEARENLSSITLMHIHLTGSIPHTQPDFGQYFRAMNFFVGENVRNSLNYDSIDYLPCFLSEIPGLFRKKIRPVDIAFIHVSPPDRHGFCSLGTSVDIAKAACEMASLIIAQINPNMPNVAGDGMIHESKIDFGVFTHEPLYQEPLPTPGEIELQIGKHIASLIENGSTIQTGIGKIPSSVFTHLTDHKHLGIHTEVGSDAMLPLLETGVIDNSCKLVYPGKIVSSFLIGTKKLYDFVDHNPSIANLDVAFVNHPGVIAKNPKVVAINSAIEIDLTGQICADSIGPKIISGVGGQIDYMRGSFLSKEGKAIIALPSRTHHKEAKIVPLLRPGAGVVTTRAHAHYIVTEYGIAQLYGKTLHERAQALIQIAHPEDRESLQFAWKYLRV